MVIKLLIGEPYHNHHIIINGSSQWVTIESNVSISLENRFSCLCGDVPIMIVRLKQSLLIASRWQGCYKIQGLSPVAAAVQNNEVKVQPTSIHNPIEFFQSEMMCH